MSTKNATLYDTDFYAWANEQAALLRAGRLSEADIENITEEIETLTRGEKRQLITQLSVLLQHLLKWRYQSDGRGRLSRLNIERQRMQIDDLMSDSPSLKSQLDDAMLRAYQFGRLQAEQETHLLRSTFPATCPFTFDDAMNPDFWPD